MDAQKRIFWICPLSGRGPSERRRGGAVYCGLFQLKAFMASSNDTANMALFCNFENIALGVRDAQYEKFDIRPVLERLLAKGSIVVKKAYCDWDRYKGFKSARSEEHTSELQSHHDLVCRLL